MGVILEVPEVNGNDELSEVNKNEIDLFVESTIDLHKDNAAVITQLVLNSTTALTASESRTRELAEQGFFKNFFNVLVGKNQQLRAQIDRDLMRSQYASQQLIQQVTNQNLLTFDLVTAVNNKLNTLVMDIESEINEIYSTLNMFFKQTRLDIVNTEERLDKLERNVDLLYWNSTIEYQLYEGKEYNQLQDEEKIVCIANDFLRKTDGSWSTADLMLLKATLKEVDLSTKRSISAKSFYLFLIENPRLIDRLFQNVPLETLGRLNPYEVPLLKGIEKTVAFSNDEKYVLEAIRTELEMAEVVFDERKVQLSLIHQFLKNKAYMNSEVEINIFDFVMELLSNLKVINGSTGFEFPRSEDEVENITHHHDPEVNEVEIGSYDVVLYTYGDKKFDVLKKIQDELSIDFKIAYSLTNVLPAVILSNVTEEKAKELVTSLNSLNGQVAAVVDANKEAQYIYSTMHYQEFKNVTYVGNYINEDSIVGSEGKSYPHSFMFNDSLRNQKSGIEGKVLVQLVEDGQEVEENHPILLVSVDVSKES